MQELESNLHLFKPSKYKTTKNQWCDSFNEALFKSDTQLSWDFSGVMSMISFGYVCGDRTLIKEISRTPWLSHIDENGRVLLEEIPKHNLLWLSEKEIAKNLKKLLKKELINVCQNRSQIFILLSGGLDSRIIAALLAELYESSEIKSKPVAVCWGLKNSRDVVYSCETAKILNFDWVHVDLSPEILYQNIFFSAEILGSMVSPIHLHGMSWFENVPKDSLVINGSYGDSVGRAEFSRRHVLELSHHNPNNYNCFLKDSFFKWTVDDFKSDLRNFHTRSMDKKPFVLKELEMQSEYMRGMIAHSMTLINEYCKVYHAFTHPDVYSYMWSLHPSVRGDKCYFELVKLLDHRLHEIPWARTNKNLDGIIPRSTRKLEPNYHQYDQWISHDLFSKLSKFVDPDWFSDLKIFNDKSVRTLIGRVKTKNGVKRDYDLFVWLASLRIFYNFTISNSQKIESVVTVPVVVNKKPCNLNFQKRKVRENLQKSKLFTNRVKPLRLILKKIKARFDFPPIQS